ncbi:MAG TPA: ATP-binding protein, partial [Longimicrobiales bacterium]
VRDSSNIPSRNWPSQLVGFEECDLSTLKERLLGKLRPALGIRLYDIEFEQKSFLVIEVPACRDTLVATAGGKVCIREGKSSRPMTPAEIATRVKALQGYDWTADDLPGLPPDSVLDPQQVAAAKAEFARRREIGSIDDAKFLESIGATRNGVLTRGGLLFLGSDNGIRTHLGDFEYRFSWKTKDGQLKLNEIWSGSVWKANRRAKDYFEQCNSEADIEFNDQTYTVPLLDRVAFHEAYLNALVHRDYSAEGMVSVNFTGDHLVITSPGGFYGGVTASNIVFHEPRHRNKSLARTLMLYDLVDRAGMGVLRMGVNSLRYGRAFPEFRENHNAVEVRMHAEYLRPGLFVITQGEGANYGIAQLYILNCLYGSGSVSVAELERELAKVSDTPWRDILRATETISAIELVGTKRGLFVKVREDWKEFFDVGQSMHVPATSNKHVAVYTYLKQHKSASNADISDLLQYSYSSQTSRFLREAAYVERRGSGPNARWQLVSA